MKHFKAQKILFIGLICGFFLINATYGSFPFNTRQIIPIAGDVVSDILNMEDEMQNSQVIGPNYTVLDIRGEFLTPAEELVLASIEGIVNQNEALLYILQDDYSHQINDSHWLNDLQEHPTRNSTNLSYTGIPPLINHFSSFFDNIIIVNESDHDSWNIGTPLCGKEKALLVCDEYYSTLEPQLNKTYPISYNISQIININNLHTANEKYEYFYENYFHLCNPKALAVYANGNLPFWGYMNLTMQLRGYLIAESIFTISDEFLPIFDTIIADLPPNIPVYGCWDLTVDNGEGKLISHLSEHGKYMHVAEFMHNIAFFSHFTLPPNYSFQQVRNLTLPSLKNQIYVSGIFSEGDNLQYVQGYMREVMWSDPNRGVYPVGWSIGPMLVTEMPYLIKYYYDTATDNDLMISGLNGKGYCYPELMPREYLVPFITDSKTQLSILDMKEMTMMKVGDRYDLYQGLDVNGFFNGYGFSEYRFSRKIGDIPLLFNLKVGWEQQPILDQIMKIKEVNPQRPIFINLHLISWKTNVTEWTWLAESLNDTDGIEVVRPDQLPLLMRHADLYPHKLPLTLNYLCFTTIGLIIITSSWKSAKK